MVRVKRKAIFKQLAQKRAYFDYDILLQYISGIIIDSWSFWGILEIFSLDMGPIYSKRHLHHDSMPFFPEASGFKDIFAQECAGINFSEVVFGQESNVHFRLCFITLFHLSFFSFSYLFASD